MEMSRVESRASGAAGISGAQSSALGPRRAFTLIEVMVVVVLLSLIVIALMSVFNGTQRAFLATNTQTDVLEGGRAAMELITGDLRQMTPSLDASNGTVNFYAAVNPTPLSQPLLASPTSQSRNNVLESYFILSRNNQTWTGTGYAVYNDTNDLYSLYRFSTNLNVGAGSPWMLFSLFTNAVANGNLAGMGHLLDGVVDFRVRAFDPNGVWMNSASRIYANAANFVRYGIPADGEVGFYMFSNTVPATVEIQMGVLEDRTLKRASTWPNGNSAQSSYLQQQAGKVHVFRQRVSVPNLDPAAYP
jgi:prepilin-type N-terminal cleavage/methylation domain-containing protein